MSLKSSIVFITLVYLAKLSHAKRGPHHPRGEFIVKRDTKRQEFSEHLSHQDKEHIEEDLTGMHVDHKDVSEMTEEEKSFFYFKVHDTDNNDFLDGLEMVKAAIHRNGNLELQDELMHVSNVVDEFLEFADINQDGFLNYAEYVRAINVSHQDNEDNPALSSANLQNGLENR